MRTSKQYFEGLKKKSSNLYLRGEKIDRDAEELMNAANVIATTFDAAADPASEKLCTATSHLTGEKINRFTHVHQSVDDLHKKQDMTRLLVPRVGPCIGRCMGVDALNALNSVSFEADKVNKGSTEYHKNFLKWLENFQRNDLVGSCAQTDTKGLRLLRPAQQPDPDAYLHVVEKKQDGIVVRGCKLHITFASVADEILVVPTRSLTKEEGDWAVAFAIPADHEGVKQVLHPHNMRKRTQIKRGFDFGFVDSYVIFDNVFIPWERVFLCGEYQHGGICALLFALFHRHSYSGCKPAMGDLLLGLASLAADINGIPNEPHVREKLSKLIEVAELGYAAGYTASDLGKPEVYMPGRGLVPYGPGAYIPNSIYANVGRCLTGEAVFEEQQILCEVAGGIPSTFPYEQDFANPETGKLLEKYTRRSTEMPIEDQIKFWMLFSDFTNSDLSAATNYGAMHGGGSPIMEQIAIYTQYDINYRKNLVKAMAGMPITAPAKKK
jgi:4-hydroxybutyryl-CoA dehydratase / vinylacetyl-CoA-Delta-isomerase